MLKSSMPMGIRPPRGQKQWPQLVGEEVQTDLLDVNKNIFDEMERHTKAMSAIYAHRHSETSSSDLNSGVSTPDTERGTGGLGLGDWDPDTEGSDLKDVRTSITAGTPLADDAGGDERADDLMEQERFEKSIFVKAALQLLLERACGGGDGWRTGGLGGEEGPGSTTRASKPAEGSAAAPLAGVVKSGFLKKAAHHSMGTIWKTKQVEIQPGLFMYEDDDSLLGKRKKTIRLVLGVCAVRMVASGGRKGHIFELSAKKGQKRLWMCSSEDERAEWVKAVHDAMVSTPASCDGLMGHTASEAPYAADMERYKSLRSCFDQATDAKTYRSALQGLHHDEQICVPFSWIRTQIADVFPMEGHGSMTLLGGASSLGAHAGLTQLWKDMMRDKVCINGQVIYGESGPESILGALARCLMTLAARARDVEPKSPSLLSFAPTGSGSPGGPALLTQSSLSSMTEVQAVAYTMEILLACNRTQSGGDTYYCVEYLFRNPGLVVLCPYSSHAEPLQLFLEIATDEPSPTDTALLDPTTPLLLSDDEGSLLAAHTSTVHATGSVGGGSTGSHRDSIFKERTRKAQSARLPSASVRLNNAAGGGSSNQHHHHHHHNGGAGGGHSSSFNPPTLTRSNSLTKLTSLSPPPDQPPLLSGDNYAKSFPPVGTGTLRPSGANDSASPPTVTSPASAGSDMNMTALPTMGHDEGSEGGGGGLGGTSSGRSMRPVIRVKIQANTSYKICPSDPQDDNEDIWSIVSARFEQHFIISGMGMVKGQELIALTTLEGSTGAKDQAGGGVGGRGSPQQQSSSSPQTVPPATSTYVAPLSPQQQQQQAPLSQPHQPQFHPVTSQSQSGAAMSF